MGQMTLPGCFRVMMLNAKGLHVRWVEPRAALAEGDDVIEVEAGRFPAYPAFVAGGDFLRSIGGAWGDVTAAAEASEELIPITVVAAVVP